MTEADITIDFETRSECNLKATGAWLYSQHPTTEVMCCAYKAGSAPAKLLTPNTFYIHQRGNSQPWEEYFKFEAHNAGFERAIYKNVMCKKHNWPEIPLDRWSCSAAKAASHGLPRSLDGASKAMNLSTQKDMTGHRLMLKLSKPRPKWKKTGEGEKWFEDPEELEKLYSYCKNDVETEYALSKALPALSAFEKKIWSMDQTINEQGISCDLELVRAAIKMISLLDGDAKDEIWDLTDGEITSLGQVAEIPKYLKKKYNVEIDNLQADTVEEFLQKENLNADVKRILELRQLNARASTKKYLATLNRSNKEGRIKDTLLYHGAHTGRWTGVGIQPHNYFIPVFDRLSIEEIAIPAIKKGDTEELEFNFGSPMDALASSLRASLTARKDKILIGADYSAIEARVLLWLVDDTEALKIISSGGDIYKDMASRIYKTPVDQVTKKQRDLGKRAILGLGYQMGAPKFKKTCWEQGKVDIELTFAKKVVDLYRTRYSAIKEFWYAMQEIAILATKRKSNSHYDYRHADFNDKDIAFSYDKTFLYCHLPSGRKLSYKDPELYIGKFDNVSLRYWGVDSVTKKWNRINTYGGKLVENIVQAIARDIMAYGMVQASENGYPIILTVHDEIISEVKDGSVDEFVELITSIPSWAEGCPIEAEGWKGFRYRK